MSNVPAALAGKSRGEATLAIQRPDELIDVADVGLEFDHEEHLPSGVPGQNVDDASLAVDCKRDLRFGNPASPASKATCHLLVQRRVASVEEPVQIARAPAGSQMNAYVERLRHGTDVREADELGMAAFDPRDDRS